MNTNDENSKMRSMTDEEVYEIWDRVFGHTEESHKESEVNTTQS